MATKYLFEVNGVDFSGMVERDGYETRVDPITTKGLTTLNGHTHITKIGERGSVAVKLNPQTEADTEKICRELLRIPCTVRYHCLQRNQDIRAEMVADVPSAANLSRCKARGLKWHELDTVKLEEL